MKKRKKQKQIVNPKLLNLKQLHKKRRKRVDNSLNVTLFRLHNIFVVANKVASVSDYVNSIRIYAINKHTKSYEIIGEVFPCLFHNQLVKEKIQDDYDKDKKQFCIKTDAYSLSLFADDYLAYLCEDVYKSIQEEFGQPVLKHNSIISTSAYFNDAKNKVTVMYIIEEYLQSFVMKVIRHNYRKEIRAFLEML